MTNKHDFTIEHIKISPINIDVKDLNEIERNISELACIPKKGETEIEVFKKFASALEHRFQARISSFSPPSDDYKHWRLILPRHGNFDNTPSRFSVSFDIKRVENP